MKPQSSPGRGPAGLDLQLSARQLRQRRGDLRIPGSTGPPVRRPLAPSRLGRPTRPSGRTRPISPGRATVGERDRLPEGAGPTGEPRVDLRGGDARFAGGTVETIESLLQTLDAAAGGVPPIERRTRLSRYRSRSTSSGPGRRRVQDGQCPIHARPRFSLASSLASSSGSRGSSMCDSWDLLTTTFAAANCCDSNSNPAAGEQAGGRGRAERVRLVEDHERIRETRKRSSSKRRPPQPSAPVGRSRAPPAPRPWHRRPARPARARRASAGAERSFAIPSAPARRSPIRHKLRATSVMDLLAARAEPECAVQRM